MKHSWFNADIKRYYELPCSENYIYKTETYTYNTEDNTYNTYDAQKHIFILEEFRHTNKTKYQRYQQTDYKQNECHDRMYFVLFLRAVKHYLFDYNTKIAIYFEL